VFYSKMFILAILSALMLASCGTTALPPVVEQPKPVLPTIGEYVSKVELNEASSCGYFYGSKISSYSGVFYSTGYQAQRVAQAFIANQPTGIDPKVETRCFGNEYKIDEFVLGGVEYAILGGSDTTLVGLQIGTRGIAGKGGYTIVKKSDFELETLKIQRGLVIKWQEGKIVDQRGGTTKEFAISEGMFTYAQGDASSIEGLLEQQVIVKTPLPGWEKTTKVPTVWTSVLLDEVVINGNVYSVGTMRAKGALVSDVVLYGLFHK
jgi:hypothetical protein